MTVNLYVPWRETEDRREAFQLTLEKVSQLYAFSDILLVDSGHKHFNRAATRNVAFKDASEKGVDVVVCCDADSIPEEQPLRAAIAGAPDGFFHYPFHEVWYLSNKALVRVRQGQNLAQIKSRIIDKCPSEGGVWVCQPETWWKAGGMDDGLLYWGCDDRAFLAAAHTMVGPPVKHEGILLCLPHTRPSVDELWYPEDVAILLQYEGAYKRPEEMKEVISGRRAYLRRSVTRPTEERRPTVRSILHNLHSGYEIGDRS